MKVEQKFCNTRSVRLLDWQLRKSNQEDISSSVVQADIPKQLVEIVLRRGIAASDVPEYFSPSLKGSMPDPSILHSMDQAVERTIKAVERGEKIAVFGDYDVDGATSGAQLVRYLLLLGHNLFEYYIPQRMSEGYGPNIPAITGLHERGAQLLLIVDSGTTHFDAVKHAKSLGMDVIVIDHHEPKNDHSLPDAILVNPHRMDDTSELTYLCTAGLIFLFMVALNRGLRNSGFFAQKNIREPNLLKLSGLAALGTVCDVASLKGFNRAIVAVGLKHMSEIVGIRALAGVLQSNQKDPDVPFEYTAHICGYRIGPPINAAGRIDNSMRGIELLINDDWASACSQALELYTINVKRKEQQDKMIKECREQVEAALSERLEQDLSKNIIVAYSAQWHPGIVGIVAGKIRDSFDQSTVLIGETGKGSARAVGGFNIGQSFLKARDQGLLKSGGGHSVAAGLTIDPDKIQEFVDFLNEESKHSKREPLLADLILNLGDLKQETVEAFDLLEPLGKDNELPMIAFKGGVLTEVRRLKNKKGGPEHLKCKLEDRGRVLDIMIFSGGGTKIGNALIDAQGRYVDVLGRVQIENFAGTRVSMVGEIGRGIEDVMVGQPAQLFAQAAE